MRRVRRTLFIALTIIAVLFLGQFIFKKYIKDYIGDNRPAALPMLQKVKGEPKRPQAIGKPLPFDLTVAQGFAIGLFARDVEGARDMALSPGGILLVSQPSAGKIVALPDEDADGVADEVRPVLTHLPQPHGIEFRKDKLYVVDKEKLARYAWNEDTQTASFEQTLVTLPQYRGHTAHSLTIAKDGTLYIKIGSSCNVCEEEHPWFATILAFDSEGNGPRVFATGLRNAPFLMIHPQTGKLWVTEMGRDFLGDNLPPDEINIVRESGDYGWPWCYGKRVHDLNTDPKELHKEGCQSSEEPVYEIAAHSAPLGLSFIDSLQFPVDWQGDLLVAYHGSWNRSTPIGYKVVRLKIEGDQILGEEEFITGFLKGNQAVARPVDIMFDKEGSLFISDDKAGYIFKLIKIS